MGNFPLSCPHDYRSVVLLGSEEALDIRTCGFLHPLDAEVQNVRAPSTLGLCKDGALNKNKEIKNHSWNFPGLMCLSVKSPPSQAMTEERTLLTDGCAQVRGVTSYVPLNA